MLDLVNGMEQFLFARKYDPLYCDIVPYVLAKAIKMKFFLSLQNMGLNTMFMMYSKRETIVSDCIVYM